jgi:uncharacterized protein
VNRYGEFIIAHPRLVIFGLIVIAIMAVFPAMNIRTDFNLEGFYPREDPVLEDYQILEDEFGRDDNTILIGFKTEFLFTEEVLQDLFEITTRLEEITLLDHVFSLWNSQRILSENDRLSFEAYLDTESLPGSDVTALKDEMTSDPFLKGFLLNEEGTATAIVLVIDDEKNTYPNRNIIINYIQEILADYDDRYSFHTSGIPYFRNQYVNMLNSEIIAYIAISSVLIIFLLWYLYRTFWGVLFPMIIVWTTLLLPLP